MDCASQHVTEILGAVGAGDAQAAEALLPLVCDELRRLAAARMAREAPGQTLQPTALVHEAWLRLVGDQPQEWNGRSHFFGAAAEAMRRILVENARRKRAQRHGGGQVKLDFQHEAALRFSTEQRDEPPTNGGGNLSADPRLASASHGPHRHQRRPVLLSRGRGAVKLRHPAL